MQLVTEIKYYIGVLGQILHIFKSVSSPAGSIPDGLPLPLTWDVATEALKGETATLMEDEKMEECVLSGGALHRSHCPHCGVRAWLWLMILYLKMEFSAARTNDCNEDGEQAYRCAFSASGPIRESTWSASSQGRVR